MKTQQVNLKLSNDELTRLHRVAAALGIHRAETLRFALKRLADDTLVGRR